MNNKNIKSNNEKEKGGFINDINNWLKSIKISCKISSYSSYEYLINKHIIPYFGKYNRKDINRNMINDFTYKKIESGLNPKTVRDILIVLRQILNYVNVFIKITMPKVKDKEIRIFNKEEQIKLERYLIQNIDERNMGIYLCLYTGLRIGEVCALNYKNIDLKNKIITINKTVIRVRNLNKNIKKKTIVVLDAPKSLSSIREIPIPLFLIKYLKMIKKDNDFFLLTGTNKYMTPRTLYGYYKKIIKELELDNFNFHTLRHTFATRCIENGNDPKTLSKILGHSNVKITLDKYVHPTLESKIKMMNSLSPLYKVK